MSEQSIIAVIASATATVVVALAGYGYAITTSHRATRKLHAKIQAMTHGL